MKTTITILALASGLAGCAGVPGRVVGQTEGIEQRLSDENIARLRLGSSRTEDVLALMGPPYRVEHLTRLEREVWTYRSYRGRDLYVQFSRDGVVREVLRLDDPQSYARS